MLFQVLSTLLLLFHTTYSATWHTVPTDPDYIGRGESAFARCSSTKLCVLGGRQISPVSILDTKTLSYSSGSPPPIELHHFQAFQGPDACAWIVGAWTGPFPDEDVVNDIWRYCADSDQWEKVDRIDRPRGSGGAFYWDGAVYLVGGNVGGHNKDAQLKPWFDRYDVDTGEWSQLPDLPTPRDHFHVVLKGTDLYVAGGRDSTADIPAFFNDVEPAVEKFNLVTKEWTRLSDFERARGGSFSALHNGNIFVMGGEGFGQAWKEVHILQDDTFEKADDMPTRRHGAGAVSCNGVLWVAGGVPTQGGGSPNTDTVAYYDGDAPNPCDSSDSAASVSATPEGTESSTTDGTKPPTATTSSTTTTSGGTKPPPGTATTTTGTSILSTSFLVNAPTTTRATATSIQHHDTAPVGTSQSNQGVTASTLVGMPTEPSSVTTVVESSVTQQPTSATFSPAGSFKTVSPTPTAVNAITEASPVEEEGSVQPSSTPEESGESGEGMGVHTAFPTPVFVADVPEYSPMPSGDSPTTLGPATTAVGMTTSATSTTAAHSTQPVTLTTVTSTTASMTFSASSNSESASATTIIPTTTPDVGTTAPATPDTDESNISGTGSSPGESPLAPSDTSAPTKTPAPNTAIGPVTSGEPVPTDNFEFNTPTMDAEAGTPEPSQDTSSGAVGEVEEGANPQSSTEASDGDSEPVCFSSDNTVQLLDGSTKFMHEVRIGDMVKVAHPDKYSPVYFFSHHHVHITAKVIRIVTSIDEVWLSMSPTHLLYANGRRVPASDVRVGDKLSINDDIASQRAVVVSVERAEAPGLHNPHTFHGDIVVNGIVASTFTSTVRPSLAKILLAPFKAIYYVAGSHPAVSKVNEIVLRGLDRFYWQRGGHRIVVHNV